MASPRKPMGQDQSPPPSALELAQHSSDELATRRIAVFRRLLSYIIPFRGRLAWGIFFGICSGLFNAVILLVMKSVFTVVLPNDEVADDGDESRFGDAIRPFEDLPIFTDFEIPVPTLPAEQEWIFVTLVCLSIPLLLLLRGLFQFLHQYCMLWLNMKVLYNLRDQCFRGVMRQSLSFFNRVKQGELIQTVANQTRTLAEAGGHLLSGWIQHPVGILSVIVVVVIMDPLYSLGALVVFPLCILPVAAIARRVRKAGGKEEEESEGLMVTLHESFSGVRLVKANSREEYQTERFNAGSRAIVKFIMRWRKAMEISSPLVEIVGATGIVIGMVYAWVTEMQYGKFMTLNLGLISLYPNVKALSRIQVQAEKCFVAAIKVFHFIDAEPEVTDRPEATGLKKSTGLIELKDVTFAYEPENPALRNVSLRFEPGKRYALVGQSGSGKSTILSLILRFYDVDDGAVRVDTRDVRDYTQASLRENIGLVSQDTFLFHDTIANNIRYGR
ncbi:MAG: ABC transporter ATP-binding protein, partial [Verrucomicrobiota bacterium]